MLYPPFFEPMITVVGESLVESVKEKFFLSIEYAAFFKAPLSGSGSVNVT